jgi:hypothetical protein
MNSNPSRHIPVALGTFASCLLSVGVASADPSTDPLSWTDELLGGLSVPAQATTSDIQISIDGMDLFPTAGNTATATSDMGDIAIAIGNGADASATGGSLGDFAFADGANSLAEAGFSGNFDSAVVFGADSTAKAGFYGGLDSALVIGTDSTAEAGFGSPSPIVEPVEYGNILDFAAAFGNGLDASAIDGNYLTNIVP